MVINPSTKQCTKCKETKLISEFHKQKGKVSGVQSHCKICRKKKSKQHYLDTREAQLEYSKQYHLDNRETRLEASRKYHREVTSPRRVKLLIKVRRIIKRLPEHRYPRFADIIMLSSKLSDLCWYSDIDEFVTTHNTKGI